MATAGTLAARVRWTPLDRILIVALLIVFSLGAPEFGIETRQPSSDATAGLVYSAMLVLPVAALVLSWRWPVLAAWLGLIGALPVVAVGALDLSGALIGPPPVGMVAVDAGFVVVALILAWRCWRLSRA
jgi:hypothetical protein